MIRKRVEDLANKILSDLEVNSIPIPIEKIARSHGLSLKKFDFGKDVSGLLLLNEEKSIIGINPNESPVRMRFTIAHELGHYVLHRNLNEKLFIDKNFKVHFRDQQSSTGESIREQEANAFAAAILMPEVLIIKEMSKFESDLGDEEQLQKLAAKFKVSTMAMTYRLANLRIF